MAVQVVYRSGRFARTVWVPIGLFFWTLASCIAVGIGTQLPSWLAPVSGAAAGALIAPAVWLLVGAHRMRMLIDGDQLVVRGWLWRSDAVIRRAAVERFRVSKFFDPRVHSLLWMRTIGRYPVKLEASLVSGDRVGIPSSFGSRRIVSRQAAELNAWVADSTTDIEVDRSDAGYVLDRTPGCVQRMPWYLVSALIAGCALAADILFHLGLDTSEPAARWVPGGIAAAAGIVASFGRLARPLPNNVDDDEHDHVF